VSAARLVVVVPVFNEARVLAHSLPEILACARAAHPGEEVFLVAVDDGSRDASRDVLAAVAAKDGALRFVSFTRNFGKEAAIHAGLSLAVETLKAQLVVVIDADLQHPPSLMEAMVSEWRQGAMVVEAVKRERGRESLLRGLAARVFYGGFTRLSGLTLEQDTDYKLLDRQVVTAILRMGERARFFRGMVRWLGFPGTRIEFDVGERAGGATGWSPWALARYAWRNLTSFSSAPLSLVAGLGGIGLVLGAALGLKALVDWVQGRALSGFSTVILLQIIFSSLVLLCLGIIGSYIARIYDELKGRPHYVLRPEDVARITAPPGEVS
jgi:glycosyltransferase involved in cell wall biosynthesis